MKYCLITFRSITPAQKAETLVKRTGIECTLQRTPKWMEVQGCGYSLRIPYAYVQNVTELLQDNDVSYRKIYLRLENGKTEEVYL